MKKDDVKIHAFRLKPGQDLNCEFGWNRKYKRFTLTYERER